jgi:PAS domain S-box-containing protein
MREDIGMAIGASGDVQLSELIDPRELQRIQDLFADSSGVASIITRPDGTPITAPSNFSNLCTRIRTSDQGSEKCMRSNEKLGRSQQAEPVMLPCLNCGLWHAGAAIKLGEQHIATWVIGQVRIKGQDEQYLSARAEHTGVNKQDYLRGIKLIPEMSFDQFGRISTLLSAFAREISDKITFRFQLTVEKAEREKEMLRQKEVEEKYGALFERSMDAIFLVDVTTGRYLNANKAAETLTGRTVDELKQLTTFELTPQEAGKRLGLVNRTSQTMDLGEVEYHRPDGTIRTALLTSISLNDRQAYGIAHDITERKKLKQDYKDFDSINEAVLESIYQGILVVNDQGMVIKTNSKFAEIWSIPGELIAQGDDKKLLDSITGQLSDPEQFLAKVNELYAQPEAESDDIIYLKDGRIIDRVSRPFYLQGKPRGRVWSFMDITEHQKVEDTIHNEQLVLRTLVDNLPDSIYCKDLACRKTLVNQVELKYMKARSEAEVLGKDDFDFYPPEIAERFYEDDQMVMQTGIPVLNREEYIIDEDGQKRWLLTSKLPLRGSDNQIVGLIGIGRDITKRKLAETEIKLKNEQLIQAHAEKDKFFSIIAHDLRNPFSSFLALTKIMDEQFSDLSLEEIHELTHSLKNSAANLYSLLENLLQWARMKQGLIPFNPTMIALQSMVDESLAIIREPAKIKGIDLINHIAEGVTVCADSNSLQTVIRNLVANAVKFTPKGGKITLTAAKRQDDTVEIVITDTGIGMSQSIIDNLFRSDARINRPGTEGEPSTGLGLLLCKEFIEKQGGTIWAVSEEGKGSEFHFTVPGGNDE